MKSIANLNLIGTVVCDPATRTISGTDFAEATLALDSMLNERKITNYLPLTFVGGAATSVGERIKAGTTVSVQATVRQGKWTTPDGQKRSKVRLQALCHEVLEGDFTTIADKNGGRRLTEGISTALLGGNLVATPELRYTSSGDPVGELLAGPEREVHQPQGLSCRAHVVRGNQGMERKRTGPEGRYAVQRHPLTVIGASVSDSWMDKDGNKRSSLDRRASAARRR
ncbi:single-stranded DNA-binding protein [Deinococcus sp. Arct2-2]|uniref:single-stranded DNA-binding protein n=1 Tax=Deinococcus sp. Arct2-2 TaxID=2568653 RepID=UPI001454C2C1|nr:single-stranded DNA-binding protein [Deinococcus sp. Arct2-2]